MRPTRDEQIEYRTPMLTFLQNGYSEADDDVVVIGFALVVEVLHGGEREVHRISSDPLGVPLAWHTIEGLAIALTSLDEVDEMAVEVDDE